MNKIDKKRPPALLTTYKKQIGASYDDIDKAVYDATILALLNEQGWICGYCQQKISNSKNATIEHYCERKICNGKNGSSDLTLDYTNMMAVCSGKGEGETHCDENKSKFNINSGLPIQVSPWKQAHINAISYTNSGTIRSSIATHNNEINIILNLNVKYIKRKRRDKFVYFLKTAGDINLRKGKDKLKKILDDDLEFSNNHYSNSFPGMSTYMKKYTK
jgi:uncharacterized protein (TIGR02646 family)